MSHFAILTCCKQESSSQIPGKCYVSVVGKPHLRSDEKDPAIETDNTAVVANISMHNWHSNVQKNVVARLVLQDCF
jgi:hypothetical protein